MSKINNWGFNVKDMDSSVHPADDFFHYANGSWIKKTNIPADRSRWGSFDILRDRNQKELRTILEELTTKKDKALSSEERKLRNLYRTATNKKRRNAEGYTALMPYISRIRDMEKHALPEVLADLHTVGVYPFFQLQFDQDDKNSSKQILRIHQGGLDMPDREYYLRTDKKSGEIRKKFITYVENTFILVGYAKKDARAHAHTILDIETYLAKKSLSRAEIHDPIKSYNKRKVSTLEKEFSGFEWKRYVQNLRENPIREIVVNQPAYIKALSTYIKKLPLSDIQTYLIWCTVSSAAPLLGDAFRKNAFAFNGKVISGAQKQKPIWKQAIGAVDGLMGDAIGRIYVKKHFPKKSKTQMDIMITDIKRAFAERIKALDWMDEKTRKRALNKLDTLNTKIGYPKKWHSYTSVKITPESFVENIINLEKHHFNYEIQRVGDSSDRDEWHMSPATVNAYYSPNFNEIVFPAAILQPPFFDPNRDTALNYGAIGGVIGHEISHAFDDSGSQFDENGNLKNWWTEKTRKEFDKRTKVLVNQYNKYEPVAGERVNGKLTLGENIADLCGVLVAYDAYEKYLSRNKKERVDKGGFSPEQRLFLGHALVERGTERPEFLKLQVRVDPHSPTIYRVNGVVKNTPAFHEAFGASKKHKLYLPKSKQADIW